MSMLRGLHDLSSLSDCNAKQYYKGNVGPYKDCVDACGRVQHLIWTGGGGGYYFAPDPAQTQPLDFNKLPCILPLPDDVLFPPDPKYQGTPLPDDVLFPPDPKYQGKPLPDDVLFPPDVPRERPPKGQKCMPNPIGVNPRKRLSWWMCEDPRRPGKMKRMRGGFSGLSDLSELGLSLREKIRLKREAKARLAAQLAYDASPQYLIDMKARCANEGRLWHTRYGCV